MARHTTSNLTAEEEAAYLALARAAKWLREAQERAEKARLEEKQHNDQDAGNRQRTS